MQIVDHNSFDLRVVVSRFRRRGSALEIVLLPMIHIGSPQFYDKITEHLRKADAVIFEGVRSRKGAVLRRMQRLLVRFNRDGLIHQREGLDSGALRAKLVHGDVSAATFEQEWAQIPIWMRMLMWAVLPFAAIYLALTGSKQEMARRLAREDLSSRDEILDRELPGTLKRAIVDVRDAHLLKFLTRYVEEHRDEARTVAVLYGAAHMRPVIDLLTEKLGYRVVSSDWVVVFDV
jgi:hypothetical protein